MSALLRRDMLSYMFSSASILYRLSFSSGRFLRSAIRTAYFRCNLVQILARRSAASQYRLMPQQRPETSSLVNGLARRELIQESNCEGIFECKAEESVEMDTDLIDCVPRSVLNVNGIVYMFRGNGDGAERVRSCVSVNPMPASELEAAILVEYL